MQNFYWQQGNEWDDNPKPTEEIDVSNLRMIGEYRVCTFCDDANCNDYVSTDSGYFNPNYYCKHKHCKYEDNSQFEVNKHYETTALYGGTLRIRIVDRNKFGVKYEYTDNKGKYYMAEIIMFDGIEAIEAWDYKGHKCYWYAKTE
jgi:hypothetical protein